MLADFKRKTNIGVGLGIIGEILARVLMNSGVPSEAILGLVVLLVAIVVFIWGCAQYSMAKGHSAWFGLFGLLSIVGLLVLYFLPDRHKAVAA